MTTMGKRRGVRQRDFAKSASHAHDNLTEFLIKEHATLTADIAEIRARLQEREKAETRAWDFRTRLLIALVGVVAASVGYVLRMKFGGP